MSNAYTAGTELTADALNNPASSYWFSTTVRFTASGAFTKATYPGLRAVRIRVVGGGGGGGGTAATAAATVAVAAGGGAGGYSEKFVLAASLGTSETVTVGALGAGGVAGNNFGTTGGTTSFGAHCSAAGGVGGEGAAAAATSIATGGGAGGAGASGDLNMNGGYGGTGYGHVNVGCPAHGGVPPMGLGQGGRPSANNNGGVGAAPPANSYGGGGGGAWATFSQGTFAGGDGAAGIVMVDVYM